MSNSKEIRAIPGTATANVRFDDFICYIAAQNSSHKRRASVCDEGPAVAMNPIVIEDQHSDTETGSVPRPPQSRASQFAISPTLRGWLELDHDRIRVQNK
ncbi:unnamed protein product, partial [Nesidiocoris tenuis]